MMRYFLYIMILYSLFFMLVSSFKVEFQEVTTIIKTMLAKLKEKNRASLLCNLLAIQAL